jgi:ubiquinone biosynthesis protein UbiJ
MTSPTGSPFDFAGIASSVNGFVASLGSAAMERITLLLNHVIASESVATDRMKPHAGKSIRLVLANWPSWVPQAPAMAFAVTPAGLLEWRGRPSAPGETVDEAADLRLTLDVANPMVLMSQWLSGERPAVTIEGDSALASDVNWLIDNLRWDIEDDLARIVGQGPAHQIAKVSAFVASGVREGLRAMQALVDKAAGRPPR